MHYCCVKLCGNNTKTSGVQKNGISFHRFPKCPNIKEMWINATNRSHEASNVDAEAQADIPEPDVEDTSLKIRHLERVTLYPKVPPEPSAYGKGKNFSRPWILQDGRESDAIGSEMRNKFKIPKKPPRTEGIRKRMLKEFFWGQMLEEVIEELKTNNPVSEYCSEYDANYVKDNFEPRNLEIALDKNMHLKYPLYGTGSSAITFYSETTKKTGPGEILEKFRRCQYFTKPMEERLDNGWVL